MADNCTRVMTLGEKWYGKGKGIKNLFFVNVGFGIGSALVINGKIYDHHSEFGHFAISNEKILCGCGNYGCLETVASGSAIERKANQLGNEEGNGWTTAQMVA
jgi:predicted NBD/HSP70 family sugar kinase